MLALSGYRGTLGVSFQREEVSHDMFQRVQLELEGHKVIVMSGMCSSLVHLTVEECQSFQGFLFSLNIFIGQDSVYSFTLERFTHGFFKGIVINDMEKDWKFYCGLDG